MERHTVDRGTPETLRANRPSPSPGYSPASRKASENSRKASEASRKASEGRKISACRRKRKESSGVRYDPSQPLEFPATPELILEAHKRKSILSPNEEWLLVELNEFECLVDSHDIIRVIAKDSKFFEVDPDELWAQFFEFVEDCTVYDDVINYDVWQEFRLKYYQC